MNTASRSGRDDLALGPIRPSLTGPGKAVSIGLVAAIFLGFQAWFGLHYGPILVLLLVAVVDYARSHQLLAEADVDVICVKNTAMEPDGLVYSATGPAGTALQMRAFGRADIHEPVMLTGQRTTVRPGPGQTSNRTYIDYRISRCWIGLVAAHREVVRLTEVRMSQAPAPWDDAPPTPASGSRVGELERVREYRPGDRLSRISWVTTARTGVPHVRDDLVVNDDVMVILVDLGEVPEGRAARAQRVTKVAALTRLCVESAWASGYEARLISWYDSDALLTVEGRMVANKLDPALEVTIPPLSASHGLDGVVTDLDQLAIRLGGLCYGEPLPEPPPPYFKVSPEGVWLAE